MMHNSESRNGYLAYDRQPVDYPKVYILKVDN